MNLQTSFSVRYLPLCLEICKDGKTLANSRVLFKFQSLACFGQKRTKEFKECSYPCERETHPESSSTNNYVIHRGKNVSRVILLKLSLMSDRSISFSSFNGILINMLQFTHLICGALENIFCYDAIYQAGCFLN